MTPDLLDACARSMSIGLDAASQMRLSGWAETASDSASGAIDALLDRPEREWAAAILSHRAHRHDWYDDLAQRVSVRDFAVFLLENRAFPAFLPLLQRTLEAQVCDEGRRAILHNIADEQQPVPHAELMRRLMNAVAAKAGGGLPLQIYPSLIDRTLVFYHGYYNDPWHLVGSLYATEVMAQHRVERMGAGLVRLGLDAADLEFIRIHASCDDDHARDWSDGVIVPSVAVRPTLCRAIATGIATCLETSARYLDDLLARVRR